MQEFTGKGRLKKIIDIKRKIEESIATKSPLIFTYRKRNEYRTEKRMVVFEKIYSFHSRFYAVGHCILVCELCTGLLQSGQDTIPAH